MFLKMRFQPSKGMSNGSHSTSTDVSRTDLNFSPSGSGKSATYEAALLYFIMKYREKKVYFLSNASRNDIRVATLALTGTLLLLFSTA